MTDKQTINKIPSCCSFLMDFEYLDNNGEEVYSCSECHKIKRVIDNKIYTVFVGGIEVNDYYLTKEEAESLALSFTLDGYNDVAVVKCF